MPDVETAPMKLPGCSIALKCADDPAIERCLDSIDDDVSINVVITPNDTIAGILRERGIPYSVTEYGNIAKSTEIGVREAEHNNVIVIDSDTWFLPGSIRRLREALESNVLAKARLQFLTDTAMSKVIAQHRQLFNDRPNDVTNPGLAMRRDEVRESCGGYIFNPLIRWTEDADLNYRVERAGLSVAYEPEAIIIHDAVSLSHDLRAAFLYGIGKRLSIEHTPGRVPTEEFPSVMTSAFKAMLPNNLRAKITAQGLDVAALDTVWQAIYLAGYHAQKNTGKWSVA